MFMHDIRQTKGKRRGLLHYQCISGRQYAGGDLLMGVVVMALLEEC